jgi:hypothetical protein
LGEVEGGKLEQPVAMVGDDVLYRRLAELASQLPQLVLARFVPGEFFWVSAPAGGRRTGGRRPAGRTAARRNAARTWPTA